MPRPKKDGTYLNCKIATPIYEQLEEHCDETGLRKTMTLKKRWRFISKQCEQQVATKI